ncbi:MAG: spore coat associated protein CotJA [Clostridia bacterium]|nr:spore coat associated protein CotJA [Clostridia bacterium]
MLYVPYQRFDKLYSEEEALERGTLFRALDLPFLGGRYSK